MSLIFIGSILMKIILHLFYNCWPGHFTIITSAWRIISGSSLKHLQRCSESHPVLGNDVWKYSKKIIVKKYLWCCSENLTQRKYLSPEQVGTVSPPHTASSSCSLVCPWTRRLRRSSSSALVHSLCRKRFLTCPAILIK